MNHWERAHGMGAGSTRVNVGGPRMTTLNFTDEELFTLFYDAGALPEGPWPWREGDREGLPVDAPTNEARIGYKQKITAAVERILEK